METNINTSENKEKIKLDFKESKYATGRRKRSIAKVWLKKGSGSIYVNGKKMSEYFKNIVTGLKTFWSGMTLTLQHMKDKKDLVSTLQYPHENNL